MCVPVRFVLALRLAALIALPALSAVSLNAQTPNTTSSNAYDVTLLAGLETLSGLKDGIGEEAGFTRPTAIWGDGTYLYVGDGPALRRIEVANRNVTTVTRLAASGLTSQLISPGATFLSGIGGLWGDGTNIYATDVVDTNVRRINLATALVDAVSGPTAMMFGLVGDSQYLYGGASLLHDIKRLDRSTGTIVDFATPPGPLDPIRCVGGSGCLGYFVASPTSLSIDGDNIYATGYNTSLRIINRLTGDVSSSPVLPFVPTSVWGSNGVVYFTEYAGSRIDKLTLATGEIDIVYPGDPSHTPFGPIWGDGSFLYIIEGDHILRLDLTTGALQPFAGRNPLEGSVDGVGTAARFTHASNLWSDGSNLYIVDRTSFGPIRKLNLATSEVTTLSTPPVRGIWGDGTYLYTTSYQAGPQLLRIGLSDGNITTFASLSDPNGGWFITGDSSSVYVSENNLIERFALDGTSTTPISISMPFYGGGAIWSDGTYLFVAGARKIVQYSIATGNTSDLAALPDNPNAIWSDGPDLFVNENSIPLTGMRLLKVSRSGEVASLIVGGMGDAAGTPIILPGYVSGFGDTLYLSSQNAIYRLTPTAMPTFSSFNLPDRGVTLNVTAPQSSTGAVTAGTGDIQLNPGSGSSSGLAIIAYRVNGIVTSETAVPATPPIRTGRIYASVADSLNTGLAINNPNDQPAAIQFYFTNSAGSSFGAGSLTLAPHSQVARFLSEPPFTLSGLFGSAPPAVGTFTFNSTIPVSAAAILIYTNERSEFLMTTMPVADLTQAPSSAPAVIPYFSQGGGWTTSVTLVNLTDIAAGGTLEFRSDDGSIVSTTPYAIAPRASSLYNMTSTATTAQTGWIRVLPSSSAAPDAAAILSSQQNGVTVSKTATAASDPATSLRLYTGTANGLQSAVTIANPALHSATVYLQPTDSDGMPLSGPYPNFASLTIPALGHASMVTTTLFRPGFLSPPAGLLRIWTDSADGITATGLRTQTNERGDFLMTAIPAFPESAATSPTASSFPTIVQGGGFTTEMVVFGNTPGQGTSGSVLHYSQLGAPQALPLN
jgi:hypothetical protein